MDGFVADTHATVWYVLNAPELSVVARQAMEQAAQDGPPIYVPSITLIELTYLVEQGRFMAELPRRITTFLQDPQNVLALAPLDLDVAQALPLVPRDQVPDMPDRIIAATALSRRLPLITRDHKIQVSNVVTLW